MVVVAVEEVDGERSHNQKVPRLSMDRACKIVQRRKEVDRDLVFSHLRLVEIRIWSKREKDEEGRGSHAAGDEGEKTKKEKAGARGGTRLCESTPFSFSALFFCRFSLSRRLCILLCTYTFISISRFPYLRTHRLLFPRSSSS